MKTLQPTQHSHTNSNTTSPAGPAEKPGWEDTKTYRMQMYDWGADYGETYKPYPQPARWVFKLAHEELFERACKLGVASVDSALNLTLGASATWPVQPRGDINDHLFCLSYASMPVNPLNVNLVLRPEMSFRQVEGYLDWMEQLAKKQFGFYLGMMSKTEMLKWRNNVISHRPCVLTMLDLLHPSGVLPDGKNDPDFLRNGYEASRIAATLAYHLVQREPAVHRG